jgi:hypothetical protein
MSCCNDDGCGTTKADLKNIDLSDDDIDENEEEVEEDHEDVTKFKT